MKKPKKCFTKKTKEMINAQLEIQLIAIVVAMACAIPGVFLVLRKMSLISDAISHSILLGIVIGFFITKGEARLRRVTSRRVVLIGPT